ncbi:MAG: hypothetical protein D6719_00680 [Candidatus Dadabacteria bacterium]|nr:MAG: hypothetical protein D6719_00680 [Candidatus Dadabacteria bacterium]
MKKLLPLLYLLLGLAVPAYAGDAATVIFKSGQVVMIEDGFREIVSEMKKLNNSSASHKILELNIGGGTFLLNVAEVVVVCRDDCKSVKIRHQLDPARGKGS